jgi:UDP-N-acetylglucosamine/UDP-N-acetylgalactosamine diphosphorylase
MKQKGAIEHMKKNNVKYLYIAPVDNILIKLGDPTCVGYLIKNGFEIVSTYVKKAYLDEKIGLHVLRNNKVNVCEYSEMPTDLNG